MSMIRTQLFSKTPKMKIERVYRLEFGWQYRQ